MCYLNIPTRLCCAIFCVLASNLKPQHIVFTHPLCIQSCLLILSACLLLQLLQLTSLPSASRELQAFSKHQRTLLLGRALTLNAFKVNLGQLISQGKPKARVVPDSVIFGAPGLLSLRELLAPLLLLGLPRSLRKLLALFLLYLQLLRVLLHGGTLLCHLHLLISLLMRKCMYLTSVQRSLVTKLLIKNVGSRC